MTADRNCLSFWFPKIEAAGLPVPRTRIVRMPHKAQKAWWAGVDNETPAPSEVAAWNGFTDEIASAAEAVGGYPCFLRTGHTSGKHGWSRTCHLASRADIASHVSAVIEYSEMAGLIGPPWDVWAVRELLPTVPIATCPRYRDMPVCREFRFFVEDGRVRCWHPYWPREALERGHADLSDAQYEALCRLDDPDPLIALASHAGQAVGGAWSVDLLDTTRGWVLIDMAEAGKSWHWPDCEATRRELSA